MPLQPNVDAVDNPQQLNQRQREVILDELNRILAHPEFNGSKRCVILFKYLVNAALVGRPSEFKERTLGIEVFGRSADYDCQADPIVRMTANEIRKRLAQYYYENSSAQHHVRISLARGSYLPQFDFLESPTFEQDDAKVAVVYVEPPALASVDSVSPKNGPVAPLSNRPVLNTRRIRLISVAGAALLIVATVFIYRSQPVQYQETFWAPFIHTNQTLSVCVADNPALNVSNTDLSARSVGDSNTGPYISPDALPATPFVEFTTANQITNWLVARHKTVFFERASTGALHIFRQGPSIFIGSFDNPWSLMLTSGLRYRIQTDRATGERWIEDSQSPSRRDWKVDADLRFNDSYVDYILISRFWSTDTQNWVVVISSLGPHGTRAASELITEDALGKALANGISPSNNIQIVLKTAVIKGNTGGPQVLAIYKW